jgi:hypothetical protein
MGRACRRREVRTRGYLKERYNLEDLGEKEDNIKMDAKEKGWDGVN